MPAPTARPVNARATFMWLLELEGPDGFVDVALVQSIKIPKQVAKKEELSSGGLPFNYKITVGYETENLVLKKLMPADQRDDWAWNWFKQAVDPARLRLGKPAEYFKRANIHLLDNDMQPIHTMTFEGVSPESVDIPELDAKKKAVLMEEVEFSVTRRIQ